MSKAHPQSEYVWGVQGIADAINASKRRTQYLIEQGKIRVTYLGPKTIIARRSELDEDLRVSIETT
jgi:hypothetical protein